MVRPRGWFEWLKFAVRPALLALVVIVVGLWIFEFDRCLRGPQGLSPLGCFVASFLGTLLALYVSVLAIFLWFVSLLGWS